MRKKTWVEKKMYELTITTRDMAKALNLKPAALSYNLRTARIPFNKLEKVAAIIKEPVEVVAASCGYIPYSLKEWMKDHPYEWYDLLKQMAGYGYFTLNEEDFICPQRRRRKKIRINPLLKNNQSQ
jgi:hypothetical protein